MIKQENHFPNLINTFSLFQLCMSNFREIFPFNYSIKNIIIMCHIYYIQIKFEPYLEIFFDNIYIFLYAKKQFCIEKAHPSN